MGVAASLNGLRATHARVQMPAKGLWYAEVSLDGEHTLAERAGVTLTIADLTLVGAVLSGGPAKGRSSFRLVAGAAGWNREIPKKSYNSDAGVKLSTILTDAAAEAGERIGAISTTPRVGPGFVRPAGRAATVLEQTADGWYVDNAGVTQLGARAASTLPANVTRVEPLNRMTASVKLASDSIAAIVPGVVVDGMAALDVEHNLTPDGLRSTVYGARGEGHSRDFEAIRAVVDMIDPNRRFRGVTEYRVVTRDGKRLNLQPVLSTLGMPTLARVKVRPGVAGMEAIVPVGSVVLVGFVNSDPARPYVCGFEDAEGEGFGTGAEFVARLGDSVEVTLVSLPVVGGGGGSVSGTVSGTITSASATVKAVD